MNRCRRAHEDNRITVMALANLIAVTVDTMRDADVPNDIVHLFLNKLDRLNSLTLSGRAAEVLGEVVDIVRGVVPDND